jgi:hypothetical protein
MIGVACVGVALDESGSTRNFVLILLFFQSLLGRWYSEMLKASIGMVLVAIECLFGILYTNTSCISAYPSAVCISLICLCLSIHPQHRFPPPNPHLLSSK